MSLKFRQLGTERPKFEVGSSAWHDASSLIHFDIHKMSQRVVPVFCRYLRGEGALRYGLREPRLIAIAQRQIPFLILADGRLRHKHGTGPRTEHMSDWYLAQTKPNADHIAARNLERQGFVTFRPLERRKVARGTRVIEQVRSFFPGYIFIRCPSDLIPLSWVNSTYGITKLVKFGQTPSRVPANVIDELQGACDEEGIISPRSDLVIGSMVELIAGTFASFVGTLVDLSPSQRALIVLDCMGREMKLSFPRAHVQAASNSLNRQV